MTTQPSDTAAGDPEQAKHDAIGEAVALIHEAICDDPDDIRCFMLRREIEDAVSHVYDR